MAVDCMLKSFSEDSLPGCSSLLCLLILEANKMVCLGTPDGNLVGNHDNSTCALRRLIKVALI